MTPAVQLVVFADDWGRHPSSAQHLVRHLLPDYPTLWVNTVGTRRPRLGDLPRIAGVVANWFIPTRSDDRRNFPSGLRVIAPKMYPGFRRPWQRRLNARLLTRALKTAHPPHRRPAVGVTTLPITADLVGTVPGIDRWVYYCVDDFSVWPGADHAVMDAMERQLVAKVDTVVCVSEVLRQRVRDMGRHADLLTHGVDPDHWHPPQAPDALAAPHEPAGRPPRCRALFWGLLDERLDTTWCEQLAENALLTLCGPGSTRATRCRRIGPTPYADLPRLAADADVLVMPYVDAPVTRAMQPLKLLEYLATYKPVVVRDLPATRAWADCCDVAPTADAFVRVCLQRAATGLPPDQRAARDRRLPGESWSEKARAFERLALTSR